MRFVKQSTSVDLPIGPFLDQTDGFTAETALTITQPDVRLKKGAAAWAQKNAAQTLTHEENGFYEVTLDATDTDTIGLLRLAVFESGALPVWEDFHVLAANVYDSLFGAATDKLDVNVEEWNTTAVPAEHTAGYPIVTVKDGTGTGEINTNAGAIALVDLVTTLTTYTGNTVQTGDSFARIGAPAGASISADIAAIEAQTDDIGAAGAGLTAVPWNAAWDAEVQSEVEDALVVHRLDELLNADSDIDGAAPPTVGSVFHELLSKTAGSFTFDQTTDSLEALRDRGDAAWITATGFSTHSAADVWVSATRTLTAATNITSTGGTTVPQTGDSFARIGAAGAGLTALGDTRVANLDAAVSSRMATYTQPTGFLAATFPNGTIANTTNITAGTITTVTTVTGLTAADVNAIKVQTDKLVFTVANQLDCNVQYVNDIQVTGVGSAGNPWGPA